MANQAVYGIVRSRSQAERIVQALVDSGIPQVNISFLTQRGKEFPEFGTKGKKETVETTRNWRTEERLTDYPAGTTPEERYRTTSTDSVTNSKNNGRSTKNTNGKGNLGTEKHTKAPEGATTGALTGGIIGGALGLLAGIGALAIPGLGPFVAAGPLMATLSGIGAGGTLGGIAGALIGAGIPEFEAKHYEGAINEGGILLSVIVNSNNVDQVKRILETHGAEDVVVSSTTVSSKNNKR